MSKVDCFSFLMVAAFVLKNQPSTPLCFGFRHHRLIAAFVFKHNNNQPSTCLFWMPVNILLCFNFNIAG